MSGQHTAVSEAGKPEFVWDDILIHKMPFFSFSPENLILAKNQKIKYSRNIADILSKSLCYN